MILTILLFPVFVHQYKCPSLCPPTSILDTGVIDKLGDELFRDILNIRRRKKVSLAFAVDYTGSMSDEIAAVKDEIIQFVTSTIGSDNEPADYVLSLFNDPGNLR